MVISRDWQATIRRNEIKRPISSPIKEPKSPCHQLLLCFSNHKYAGLKGKLIRIKMGFNIE
jgi:hypothetical protein